MTTMPFHVGMRVYADEAHVGWLTVFHTGEAIFMPIHGPVRCGTIQEVTDFITATFKGDVQARVGNEVFDARQPA